MIRLLLLLIGYAFGLIQNGYFYGKKHGIDIHTMGSGNVGATNVLRVFGKKAGVLIMLCDMLKAFIPCFAVSLIFRDSPDLRYGYLMWTALGTALGHNFPCYLKFKGVKGVASAGGMLLALDWRLFLILIAVFVLIVVLTKYVSLGSITVMALFSIITVIFSRTGVYPLSPAAATEFNILCIAVGGLSIVRHAENIKRLVRGTENRIRL